MNKTELVEAIAKESGLSGRDSEAALNAMIGFGTFSVTRSKARKGRNPATGEAIKIKASNTPRFKAGKTLKDYVNGVKK